MPSPLHEILLELFENQPRLAPRLLTELGWRLPPYERVTTDCADLTVTKPTEYRADRVVLLSVGSEPVLAVVLEVQLRPDDDKRWSWPVYVTTLRARRRCPTVLLVLCPDARTTAWAAEPIDLGYGLSMVRPLALGPEQVPIVTDPSAAVRMPELAVLSAIAHQNSTERDDVFEAFLAAIDHLHTEPGSVSAERGKIYLDLVVSTLSPANRSSLEALMTTAGRREYLSDTFRELVAEGREQGLAEGRTAEAARLVLTVLNARKIYVPERVREQIEGCDDLDQLEVWMRRSVTAEAVVELFD